jgi:protein-disulfide isomerase
MNTSIFRGSTDKNGYFINFLLFLQVVLSAIILYRLINLEKIIGQSGNGGNTPIPTYVDGVTVGKLSPIGENHAKILIVEFSDFQCPYCAESNTMINSIISTYPDQIQFFYRDFPLSDIHPNAIIASLAGRCANEQGNFWKMHDFLFTYQDKLSQEYIIENSISLGYDKKQLASCINEQKYLSDIQDDINDGRKFGVNGTPTFFINGYMVAGGDKDQILSIINQELKK